jgi:hypothetical protein
MHQSAILGLNCHSKNLAREPLEVVLIGFYDDYEIWSILGHVGFSATFFFIRLELWQIFTYEA